MFGSKSCYSLLESATSLLLDRHRKLSMVCRFLGELLFEVLCNETNIDYDNNKFVFWNNIGQMLKMSML